MLENVGNMFKVFAVPDRQRFGVGRIGGVRGVGYADRGVKLIECPIFPGAKQLPCIGHTTGGVTFDGGWLTVKAKVEVSVQTSGGTFEVEAQEPHSQVEG